MLIKCPECGQEISLSSEICVHCGCKITVCPDCGKAFAGIVETCDSCGCKIKPHTEDNGGQGAESERIFRSSLEQGQKLKKTIGMIGWGIAAVSWVFIIIIVSKCVSWNKLPPLEKLANLNSTYNSIDTLIPICCIFAVFDFVSKIPNELTYFITSRRLLSDGVNTDDYYRSYVNNNQIIKKQIQKKVFDDEDDRKEKEEKENEKYSFCLYAVWLIQNKKGMGWLFLKIGFNVVLSVAEAVCIGVSIDNSIENYFRSYIVESKTSFDWMALIPIAVILVIEVLGNLLINLYQKKSVAKWQKATDRRLGIA